MRPVVVGEVLFDCFPDGRRVLGGAPLNLAWHLRGLGHDPLLVTRVGRDPLGDEVVDTMARWGLDTSGVQRDPDRPTGRVVVRLTDGEPSYDIAPGQAWDAIEPVDLDASVVAIGTLAWRSRPPPPLDAPTFLDVNLRAPWFEPDRVRAMVAAARWVKLHRSERERLDPLPSGPELTVVTDGGAGAVAHAGARTFRVAAVPPARLVDTVGAGDAFSAVLLLGILRGWPLAVTLPRAAELAGLVCGVRGALLHDRSRYEALLEAWEASGRDGR